MTIIDSFELVTEVTAFRAYSLGVAGPFKGGEFKLTLGTDLRHKDAMWLVSDYPGEYFEVVVRTRRTTAVPHGWELEDG